MKQPYYRILEMNKIYEVFCDEENKLLIKSNYVDINERKRKLKNIIKAKFRWLNDNEFNNFYKTIKNKEIDLYLTFKKKQISSKYREKIIKLFCSTDINNDNLISIDEFKMIMIKLNIADHDEIKKMFLHADINNDGDLSIDEFIDFLTINSSLLEKLDEILEFKLEINTRLDKRNILFKNFPGSPLKNINSWRPSLANLRSPNSIKREI